jgi:hypothetical protein
MWGPLRKYISALIRLFDGSAVLNSRQTDIQTVQTIWTFFDWKKKIILRVVSSILRKGLYRVCSNSVQCNFSGLLPEPRG